MNRAGKLAEIRGALSSGQVSLGSWIQLRDGSTAEIMGAAGYDWVAVDMEHGSISVGDLPDIFRALELGGTLPLVRLAEGTSREARSALDAGAAGVIIPMIESAEQLASLRDITRWPPAGRRGVGFARVNLYGSRFDDYGVEAQAPLLAAMIETSAGVERLAEIVSVEGLDAVLIGPYDLSASIGRVAEFEHPDFISAMERIRATCAEAGVPVGVHVVQPDRGQLDARIAEGYRFIAYSIDSVMLWTAAANPLEDGEAARG
jgi:2-dehydro-3-deoxyglucarate aldolase